MSIGLFVLNRPVYYKMPINAIKHLAHTIKRHLRYMKSFYAFWSFKKCT